MNRLIALAAALLFTSPAWAQTPELSLPLDCTIGEDCWIANYVDVEPAEDTAKDYKCGAKTAEAHQGTDFAIRSRYEMKKGVDVLAAMDGKIIRTRDGENDDVKADEQYAAIREENKDCGNGILIQHALGQQSFYCHLKEDSITVELGEDVKAGQKIAQIGQSGDAQFPHLHFAFIWEGGHIDPFTGLGMNDGCGQTKQSLWKQDIAYDPYAVFDGGFEAAMPDFEAIKRGRKMKDTIRGDGDALVYWIGFYHAKTGDEVELTITNPAGEIYAETTRTVEEDRKLENFFYTGRKLNRKVLEAGYYEGSATFKREGFPAKTYAHSILVE